MNVLRRVLESRFGDYDPRSFVQLNHPQGSVDIERLERYLEERRMTAPEVVSMTASRPF